MSCETVSSEQIDSDIRSEATDPSDKKKKITDLNIICLEEIFEYLDLENLLNVADSNKRLNIAACFVFRRKHGKRGIALFHSNENRRNPLSIHNENPKGGIYVHGISISLRFLRCFGCVTSKLNCCYHETPQYSIDFNKIWFYINEYCAESLIELHIRGYKTNSILFPHLQRPFVNIETLIFWHCTLESNVMQFNKWFPKMQHLELHENQMVEKECIEMNFPNLTHLRYHPVGSKEYLVPHLENIIRLNSNLLTLKLNYWSEKLLQNISNYLPQLEELTMSGKFLDTSEPDYISGQVYFKSLKKLNISFNPKFSERFLKTNFSFDQLEELQVDGISFNDLMTFVEKHSTIKKLKLCYYRVDDMSTENALRIAKALPLLSQLYLLLLERFSVDEIIRFVNDHEQVNEIYFRLYDQSEADDLRAKLGSKWKVTIRFWSKWILLQRTNK